MRRYCLITHFLLLFSLSLSAQKIVFTPQWKPQSQFAGYYAAQKLGYYKEAGLDVNFLYMEASTAAITSLRENRSQVITLMLSQALKECDEGNQLVNLLQTSQRSSLVLISNPDKPLNQVSQFKGIRIGYINAGFNEIPEAFNRIARLGWEPIYFEQSFNLLLYGVIDATVAMEYNEMQQVIYSGVSVSEKNVFRFADHGYNVPEDGLYTTKAYYETHKREMDAFAEASRKGWEWVHKHPKEALDIVMEEIEKAQGYASRVLQKKGLEVILDAQIDRQQQKVTYALTKETFDQVLQILKRADLIKGDINYQTFVKP